MKIIQLSAHFYPVIGGKETAILNISKELIKLGHEVEVFTSDFDSSGKRIKGAPNEYEGVKIRRFKSWFMVGPTAVFYPGIIPVLLKEKYDIILAHTYRQPQTDLSLLIGKMTGKPVFLMTPGNFMPRSGLNNLFVKLYDSTVSYLTLRFYKKIFYVGNIPDEHVAFFRKRGVKRNKIKIFQNGVEKFEKVNTDDVDIRKKYPVEGKICLTVGSLSSSKGHDLLLDAISYTKEKATYFFVGPETNFKTVLNEKIKQYQLDNVVITGALEKKELAAMYQQSDLFIFPSRYEPFGIVALEAMINGLPIIATKHGGTKEFVREPFGKIVDPFKSKELADAIESFLVKPYNGEEGIKLAENYSWSEQVKHLTEQINQDR